MTTTTPFVRPQSGFVWPAVTCIGYILAGWVSRQLVIPPGEVSPLCLSTGVALVAALTMGWRALPGIVLGAVAVYGSVPVAHAGDPVARLARLAMPILLALGAAAQATWGAWLVRRHVEQPLTLSQPRDLVQFLRCALLSSAGGAAMAGLALWLTGTVSASRLAPCMAAWFMADALGILLVTPILLTLVGQPRSAWSPRRTSVGLTLTLATLLLGLGIHWNTQNSQKRLRAAFDNDATRVLQALSTQLHEPLLALQALHGVFAVSGRVSVEQMREVARPWVAPGVLQAMAWSEHLHRAQIGDFEAQVRAAGPADYKVFDRADAPPNLKDDDVVAVRYIEPLQGNATALGLNALSIAATRTAIERARRTGAPAATAGFTLVQQARDRHQVGVVIYQSVGADNAVRGPPAGEFRGAVSVVLGMDDQLRALQEREPTSLQLCLIDITPGQPAARLAGIRGCDAATADLQASQTLDYAGRLWKMQATAAALPGVEVDNLDEWLAAWIGLLSVVMLGGFMLTVSGRTHRIESAVRDRTAALQAEVHEREVAEAALRESEQRFRNILNSVPIGVVYADLKGQIRQVNPRFCLLLGYAEAELLRMGLSDCIHPDDMEQDAQLLAQLIRGDIPMYRRHRRYVTRQGDTVWAQLTVSLLRDSQDKPRSIVGVVEDITEHLRLEEAERARESAEASNRAKSEFLSRMSHELRTPLNAMLGFAQLLEMDPQRPLSAIQQPWVAQIQQAGWHLLEMINDVLDLSRIESGNFRMKIETLILADLLDATLALVHAQAVQRGIVISQELATGAATVLGDATRVKQILTNLLSNAVKYNVDDGRIHISARAIDVDRVEIMVADTGLGMTEQQMSALFQPFNRLGRERSGEQGTGIGLVISKRLAETMGGALRARSVHGRGSAFILSLPCLIDPDTVRSDLDELAPVQADYHRRVVHYVEDNETNVEVMRGILAQRAQVELRVSFNGRDGLRAIRSERPDLVLLDLHLPDMSGLDILRELRADAPTAALPIVVVSADALAQQIDAALDASATHYLTKPFSVSELLHLVDELLERIDTQFGG